MTTEQHEAAARRNYAETSLHIKIAGWLAKHLRDEEVWFSTFPAGGGGYDRGKILREMKMRPGVPDIFPILWLCDGVLRVYGMEVKVGKNALSDTQRECHAQLSELGVKIEVVRSMEDAKAAVAKWQLPVRSVSKLTERLTAAFEEFLQQGE